MQPRRPALAGEVLVLGLVSLAGAACSPKPAEVRVTPAKTTIYGAGRTTSLRYDILDKKGNAVPGEAAVWTSDRPRIATVDANGTVRSVSPGRATVTATYRTLTGSTALEVLDVASLTVSPARVTLVGPAGSRMALFAETRDSKGNLSPLKPKWLSGDANVATVDAEGTVTSVAEGRTTVLASLGADLSSACDVRILNREIAAFELTPVTLILKTGETQRFTATIRDVTGVLIEDAALAWSSSDPRTAIVSNGAVTGVARGSAKISVATSTKTLTADVVVN